MAMDLQCVIWIAAIGPVVKANKMCMSRCEATGRTLVLLIPFGLFVFDMLLCYDFVNILKYWLEGGK